MNDKERAELWRTAAILLAGVVLMYALGLSVPS